MNPVVIAEGPALILVGVTNIGRSVGPIFYFKLQILMGTLSSVTNRHYLLQ